MALCDDLERQVDIPQPQQSIQKIIEANNTSNNNRKRSNTDLTGNIILELAQVPSTREEDRCGLDYRSAADTFNKLTQGLSHQTSQTKTMKRMSSIQYKKMGSQLKTVVAMPSKSEQVYLADQYDSFSRTVMLQNLIQNSVNEDQHTIRDVRDPFLNKLISVGGIVVVVHPFHGSEEFEFKSLQTGDLLRVVKFYIKEPEIEVNLPVRGLLGGLSRLSKRISCGSESPFDLGSSDSTVDGHNIDHGEVFLDKPDPNYPNINCTGILLSSYLEFVNENLSLKLKESAFNPELELLKDFPLRVISLETTLLTQISTGTEVESTEASPIPW